MLTQPSGTDRENLEELGKQWLKEKYQKPGNVFLEAVHRLDQAVSGIVLFAKTSKALSRLTKAIREHKVVKVYHARVEIKPKESQGTLEHFLKHGDHCSKIVPGGSPGAKRARLHYRTIEEGKTSILEVTLETGRYHQIRCQLSAIGSPILGDRKYGSQQPYSKKGIALSHVRMEFQHPISGETLVVSMKESSMDGLAK